MKEGGEKLAYVKKTPSITNNNVVIQCLEVYTDTSCINCV